MLSQTRKLILESKRAARDLDQLLIRGRVASVGRSLALIEGRQHSDKYVRRLAGISPDTYRRSVTERFVEWFGATAAEDAVKAALLGAFLVPLLAFPLRHTIYIRKDFWALDADISASLSELRKAVVTADRAEAQMHLCKIKIKVDEALQAVGQMDTF